MTTTLGKYILVGQTPVPCADLLEWARWFENADRIVRQDTLAGGEVRVSTVFLGLDHEFGFPDPGTRPILFETMVFDDFDLLPDVQLRCSEWLEAEAQHRVVLAEVNRELKSWKMRLRRALRRLRLKGKKGRGKETVGFRSLK